jgi:hypothetical protein
MMEGIINCSLWKARPVGGAQYGFLKESGRVAGQPARGSVRCD